VQVYVATDAGPVRRPARELRAFTKVALEPGEQRTVSLTLDRRAFAYWDIQHHRWVVAPGEYRIQVGENAASIVTEESVKITGDVIIPELSMDSTVKEWFGHPIAGPALMQGMTAGMTPEQQAQAEQQQDQLRMVESMRMRQFVGFLGSAMPMAALDQLIEATRAAR